MTQPPFNPPPGPGQPASPYPPPPPGPPVPPGPPPAKGRRPLTIALISAAVVAALCLGVGCVGFVAYYLSEVRTDGGSDPVASGTPESSRPLSCGGTVQPARSGITPVGLPDFDGAARTGTATMQMTTNLGPIVITMDRARTPCTVASFQHLAGQKFFDRSTCHRLVTEGLYVLQCGDPTGTGAGGPDYQFGDENLGGAKYDRGVVAMANTGSPGTNSSQFFIIFRDSSTALEPLYTPFGTVTTGLDIVDRVAAGGHDNSSTAGGGVPKLGVTIESLTVN